MPPIREVIEITAVMPITIPKMVRIERPLLALSASQVSKHRSRTFMLSLFRDVYFSKQLVFLLHRLKDVRHECEHSDLPTLQLRDRA